MGSQARETPGHNSAQSNTTRAEVAVRKSALNGHRVKRGPAASGDIQGQGQLVGNAELLDQAGKGFAQIRDGGLRGVTFTVRAHARTVLGVRAPDPIFVLLNAIGDVHNSAHYQDSLRCRLTIVEREFTAAHVSASSGRRS